MGGDLEIVARFPEGEIKISNFEDVDPRAEPGYYDAIVIAVGHRQFADMGGSKIRALGKPKHVLYDVKHLLPAQDSDARV